VSFATNLFSIFPRQILWENCQKDNFMRQRARYKQSLHVFLSMSFNWKPYLRKPVERGGKTRSNALPLPQLKVDFAKIKS